MKVPVYEDDGKTFKRHTDGEFKGQPIMRNETRAETLARLRAKYEPVAASDDAFAADHAREMLDLFDLIENVPEPAPVDPSVENNTAQ